MAGKKKWIKNAIKHPGALRRKAGVKRGKKIGKNKLASLARSKNSTTRRQANLAITLSKLRKRKKR